MRGALAFLTVVPVGRATRPPDVRTLLAFPVAGLVVGLAWVAVAAGVGVWWGPLVAAAAVLAVDAAATGGLHLDGVADVGDVVGSRRHGPEALEVARDPHVGALGVATLGILLLLRFTLLAALLDGGSAWTLAIVPVVGRSAMVLALGGLPRGEGSSATGLVLAASLPVRVAVAAVAVLGLVLATDASRAAGAVAVAGVLIATVTTWWRRRVGAPSGDVTGFIGVLCETATLAVIAV